MNLVKGTIYTNAKKGQVSKYVYSHFMEHLGRCVYPGVWVGEDSSIPNDRGIRLDVTQALKALELPALRWPGGCFADNYHWQDGIGPRSSRPRRFNLWWHQPETNEFGTHEFIRFCRMIGTEPYICANVGSGTVEEARSWVEYCNSSQDTELTRLRSENGSPEPFNVKFWGIGNENWGCGGSMEPAYYGHLYRNYATYMRKTSPDIKLIACGSHPRVPEWDGIFLETLNRAHHLVDYIAIHIYSARGMSDLNYSDDDYYELMGQVQIMEEHLERATALCRAYSTNAHQIGLIMDEWGTWFKEAQTETGLYQNSTMMDAVFTALSFHLFHEYIPYLYMTNIAQTINVLQSLILTEGPLSCLTPTYYVYDLFKGHKDGTVLDLSYNTATLETPGGREIPEVSISATYCEEENTIHVTAVNLHLSTSTNLDLALDLRQIASVHGRVLTSAEVRDHNTPKNPDVIKPSKLDVQQSDKSLSFALSPHSVAAISINLTD
ncbi:MAG: alpha-N-arabinofuranosidase [Firmicutes bacterium]|jgi:alpha-N-arabinofuranosidase|nr:alpha-N-arabinofuranosidase [Bacillota bacterium]